MRQETLLPIQKPGLRQFTIIDTKPMPSFEGQITGEDLDFLVRYLGSLPLWMRSDAGRRHEARLPSINLQEL
jgi:hypothetical protein